MLDLEDIVLRWKVIAEASPVNKHPTVWVAYYGTPKRTLFDRTTGVPRTTELLGSLAATEPNNVGNAVLFLASPWSTVGEIEETVVAVDVLRTLHITQFVDKDQTQRSTDWQVPYGMADDGSLVFGVAVKAPSAVWEQCQMLWECRKISKGKHDFHQAFTAALKLAKELL